MQNRLKVFSGNSNRPLAEAICSLLEVQIGGALVGRFSDGEVRVEIHDNVRGMDVYVIQSTCPPANENLVELLVLIDALKRASASRINVIVPYYGYGRQDQKDKPRVSITAKVVADMLSVAGASRLISIDMHASQIQGFFKISVEDLDGMTVLVDYVKKSLRGDEIVVAPDAGGVERARDFASRLKVGLAIMDHRNADSAPYSRIVGNVAGHRVIILDDMVDTGRTLVRTVEGARVAGAACIDACCFHAVFSGDSVEALQQTSLNSLIVTDTIPASPKAAACAMIERVSIAPMLAEVIKRVHFDESVSSMFSRR
ncbi:MAG: ribose-phosphate pyrophosphokinase [Syntrophobacteraceae bacterium]